MIHIEIKWIGFLCFTHYVQDNKQFNTSRTVVSSFAVLLTVPTFSNYWLKNISYKK